MIDANTSATCTDEPPIDVWLAYYRELTDERLLCDLRALMSDAERQQESRFHFADDRLRYRVTRAMTRTVLSRYAAIAPAQWLFSANAYGRPEIANPGAEDLRFNLSHTGGLIALAVGRRRAFGIDVENVAARQVSEGIAERFFAPSEAAELATLPAESRQDRFFEYWTFKESYIKARGMGLSLPLDRFSFQFPNDRLARLSIEPELGDSAERWALSQYRPRPGYLMALCAERLQEGGAPAVTVRVTVPTVADDVLEMPLQRRSEPPAPLRQRIAGDSVFCR